MEVKHQRDFWEKDNIIQGISIIEKLIGGDLNDHIGETHDEFKGVHGFSYEERNEEDGMILDLVTSYFIIVNTHYKDYSHNSQLLILLDEHLIRADTIVVR